MDLERSYEAPKLAVLGTVQEVTQGFSGGPTDLFLFRTP